MALTRRMLKAMGIEDEKIDQIIDAHTETVDALKEERDTYKADAEKLTAVQKELDGLKRDGGDWQAKYEKEHTDFEAYRDAQVAKETKAAKETAYRKLLKDAGVSEKRIDAIVRISDIDSIELTKEGAIKDADKRTEAVKTEFADFIVTTHETGAAVSTPPAGGGKQARTKEEIMAIKDSAERQKAIAENITLFKKG